MALTVNVLSQDVEKNKRAVVASVLFDSSYPTGGEALSPAAVGLKQIDSIQQQVLDVAAMAIFSTGGQIALGGTPSAPLLLLYAAGAQAANLSDQSGVTRIVKFFGS